ncbi:MAG: hypothetical protein K0R71_26 [Bacillales bacterium]|jgi:uncharacterized protein YkwD|nr:hypothetical protein [Bacillales bacterium]
MIYEILKKEKGREMKTIFRAAFLCIFISIFSIYYSVSQQPPISNDALVDIKTVTKEKKSTEDPGKNNNLIVRPTSGLSTWIGKTTSKLNETIGAPDRIDKTEYGYDWWIYNKDLTNYRMFAVSNEKIVSVIGAGANAEIEPFHIGQNLQNVFPQGSFESTVVINWKNTIYRFELSEGDFVNRPLIKLDDIYAQIYIDNFTKKVTAIRFLNKSTLVLEKPYELTYTGVLEEVPAPTDEEWGAIQKGYEKEIVDFTNVIRNFYNLPILAEIPELSVVSRFHSQDMFDNKFFSHQSSDEKKLADRLNAAQIPFAKAGENIAAKYVDPVAAVEGWLNSTSHREALLDPEYSHIGVGIVRKLYTQNFIQQVDLLQHE